MKVFLNGIAGTGMSSLAGLFSEKGWEVWGSDNQFYPPVDKILENMKAKTLSPYNSTNIPADVDFCVIGNVISRGNPEAEHILNNGIPYYSMAEALYQFFIKGKKSITVCGTHGKTTITSFIAHMLDTAGKQPGFFIGGKPQNFPANYAVGEGEYFVTEGDEYETSFFDRSSKFLKYHPFYLVLSALEYDHLDFFTDEKQYIRSFWNLVNQVPGNGLIIVNNDYPMNREVIANAFTRVITYGTAPGSDFIHSDYSEDCETLEDCEKEKCSNRETGSPTSDYIIKDIEYNKESGSYRFVLRNDKENKEAAYQTSLTGRYNLWNLTAGIILAYHLGIPDEIIRRAVDTFAGVERRLKVINRVGKTVFFEDFAHHPTSIKNVLESLKDSFPGRKIITLFEPRSWSLRRNFFQERLACSFFDSAEVVIKEVYQKEKIPENERLDLQKLKKELEIRGKKVLIAETGKEIEEYIMQLDFNRENVVAVLSNGSFDNLPAFIKKLHL